MKLNSFKCNRCQREFGLGEFENNPLTFRHEFGYESVEHDGEIAAPDFCPECSDYIANLINAHCLIPIFMSNASS